jgi:hypothetical protein
MRFLLTQLVVIVTCFWHLNWSLKHSLDVIHGLSRTFCEGRLTPCCKLRSGILLTRLTLTATYLILLAGDVSLNPGPVQSLDDRKDKMTFWSFNARSIVIKREN